MAISYKLEKFEGPLDLLLHLIEKNKVDIYDIPIVEITKQYLDYVNQMALSLAFHRKPVPCGRFRPPAGGRGTFHHWKVPKGCRGRPKGACGVAAPGPPGAKQQCTASLAGARPARLTYVPGRATVAFGAADPSPGSWVPVYPWSGGKGPPWQGYPAAVRAAAKVPYKVRTRYEPCRSRNRGKIGIPLGRRSHPPKEKPFRATRKPIFPCTAEKQPSPGYGKANSISRRFTPASS